jgi:phosphoribosyl-AMP cyclohydrolase
MRQKLGTFRYAIELSDAGGHATTRIEPVVDTGALYSQFQTSLLESLGYRADATRRFRLADGSVAERPIGDVRVKIGSETRIVTCTFGPDAADALLGATTLEAFSLAPDPVNETLNPTVALLLLLVPLEDTDLPMLDFNKLARVAEIPGLLPCAVQNGDTGEVILVAYVNEEALQRSIETRSAVFWSTSRNELWEKGQTSGETFDLLEVRVNCEQNSLLYVVRPRHGPSTGSGRSGICHTKNAAGVTRNCFYRRLDFETGKLVNLDP